MYGFIIRYKKMKKVFRHHQKEYKGQKSAAHRYKTPAGVVGL